MGAFGKAKCVCDEKGRMVEKADALGAVTAYDYNDYRLSRNSLGVKPKYLLNTLIKCFGETKPTCPARSQIFTAGFSFKQAAALSMRNRKRKRE